VNKPRWLSKRLVLLVHAEQLSEHGGGLGLRDEGLLDSALARPEMKAHYGNADLSALAAAYAYGVAQNHPFLDGNKRTAYVALELFLALNGHVLTASDEDSVVTFLQLAAGDLTEDELTIWVRNHMAPDTP
jgi:death-on-curing protein